MKAYLFCDSVEWPVCGDCRPGECTFSFFLFIQNPGDAAISIISVTKLPEDPFWPIRLRHWL